MKMSIDPSKCALYNVRGNGKDVSDVSGDDLEDRLFAYLSEILFIMDAESVALCRFTVSFDGDRVRGKAYGEPLDLRKHHPKTEIKAITYHMMRIDPGVPELTVVFDA